MHPTEGPVPKNASNRGGGLALFLINDLYKHCSKHDHSLFCCTPLEPPNCHVMPNPKNTLERMFYITQSCARILPVNLLILPAGLGPKIGAGFGRSPGAHGAYGPMGPMGPMGPRPGHGPGPFPAPILRPSPGPGPSSPAIIKSAGRIIAHL